MNRPEDHDLDDWLNVLRGGPGTGAHPQAEDEAAKVRAALLALSASERASDARQLPPPDVFMRQVNEHTSSRRLASRRRLWAWGLATAASLLVASVMLRAVLPDARPVETYRGQAQPPVLRVDEPARAAKDLASRLRALGYGVQAQQQAHDEDWLLVLTPPSNLTAAQKAQASQLLATYELTLPPNGTMQFRLVKR